MARKRHATTAQIEGHLDARQSRRMKTEDRALEQIEKREAAANAMIGELNSGKLHVYPVGASTEKAPAVS